MGIYARWIFPHILDAALSREETRKLRGPLLDGVTGEILEVGFGTGLNLPHYPARVHRITAVDPNPGVGHLAAKRIARSSIDVTCSPLNAERLAFADGLFDTVVSTFTLCSIRDVEAAPAELRRVMKPTGRLHFLEHGLADDPRVRQWQHRLTPLNRRIGDGYHLNRNAAELLRGAGFRVESLQAFYLRSVPRVGGYLYSATAVKGSAKAFPLGPEADR